MHIRIHEKSVKKLLIFNFDENFIAAHLFKRFVTPRKICEYLLSKITLRRFKPIKTAS